MPILSKEEEIYRLNKKVRQLLLKLDMTSERDEVNYFSIIDELEDLENQIWDLKNVP